mmetsp:Transcript_20863/g.46335  ORF Transcript_20863/g.46335 Transcript_20863/m.46335 type:complete len:81 (+) Transcript_20863:1746-1988(+)
MTVRGLYGSFSLSWMAMLQQAIKALIPSHVIAVCWSPQFDTEKLQYRDEDKSEDNRLRFPPVAVSRRTDVHESNRSYQPG